MTLEAWVVTDLGFGDAGKGTITDFLVRERGAQLVVRHNGGAQAGHNVVTPDGRHHTFSQFGAGSFVPGVGTHLGPAVVLHPGAMLVEAEALARVGVPDALERTTVDARATLVSPFQQAAGRLRELLRGDEAHGTCGVGIGEAVADRLVWAADSLCAGDLANPTRLRQRLAAQQQRKLAQLAPQVARLATRDARAEEELELLESPDVVERVLEQWRPLARALRVTSQTEGAERIAAAGVVVFEGAQGMLIDERVGFHPHTTWSDCSARGAHELLEGLAATIVHLGVTRAYSIRHGAGPFPTADPLHRLAHPEPHNRDQGWQGPVRTGALDLPLLRYAIAAGGRIDGLAVTHLDRATDPTALCVAHEPATRLTPGPAEDLLHRERLGRALRSVRPVLREIPRAAFVSTLERELAWPGCVLLTSRGPTAVDKSWRTPPEDFLNREPCGRL